MARISPPSIKLRAGRFRLFPAAAHHWPSRRKLPLNHRRILMTWRRGRGVKRNRRGVGWGRPRRQWIPEFTRGRPRSVINEVVSITAFSFKTRGLHEVAALRRRPADRRTSFVTLLQSFACQARADLATGIPGTMRSVSAAFLNKLRCLLEV